MQVGDTVFCTTDNREVKIEALDGATATVSCIINKKLQSLSVPLADLSATCPARDRILSKMTPEAAGLVGRNPR